MKVFIAVPCLDQLSARFVQCLLDLQAPEGVELSYHLNMGTLVYDSRNTLAEKAIASKDEYTLWLDSDMTFMPDTLTMMLQTMREKNLQVLTGMYFRRRHPWTPTLLKTLRINKMGVETADFGEIPTGLFEVEGCGFGCVLMKTDVLMNVLVAHGYMFSPIGIVGEDLSFCWRLRQCGYKIVCDPSIALGHEVHTVITKSNRRMFTNGNDVKTQD